MSFVVQLAQGSIKIFVPAFVRTPIIKIAPLGAQQTLQGRFRDTPGACRGRSRPSPSTTWAPWDSPGGSQDRLLVDFGCPEDQNCFKFHQSFDGNSIIFRRKFDQTKKIGRKLIKMGSMFDQNSTLIKNLDRNARSTFLILSLIHI